MSGTSHTQEEEQTIIIDIGEGSTKVGFAGKEKPTIIFPTVTGKPKYQQMTGIKTQEIYVGKDTKRMRGVLKLDYPVKRGVIMDWNQYYAILNHIFYDVLRVDSRNCNVIYIVPPLTPPETIQYYARVLFETHQCKSVAMIDSATTAIFSIGETTGLSIELGCGLTHVTPVIKGEIFMPSIKRLNLAGIDIEEQLSSIMTQYGIFKKKEIIKEIKEKVLKIGMNPEEDSQNKANDVDFIMPDGEHLAISAYMTIMSAEILFNPVLVGINAMSLPQAIIASLKAVNPIHWKKLLRNIVFSGGTSFIEGLSERVKLLLETMILELGPFPEEVKTTPQINNIIPNSNNAIDSLQFDQSKMDNCPKCGELINPADTETCSSCGFSLKMNQIEMIDENSKLSRKEKKLITETAFDDDLIAGIASEVQDEYGTAEDFEAIDEIVEKEKEKAKIRIVMPEDRLFASFKGAAILGLLPTFKKYMVNYEQYLQNPNSVIINFKDVIPQ